MSKERFNRSSGIVMPIFSLPSKYGIGTMGKAAYDFVDWLKKAGQKYWQVLPWGHTDYGDSPYQTFSTVAGNPYFIDLDILVSEGLLSTNDLPTVVDDERVDYENLGATRLQILRKAYKNSHEKLVTEEIETFERENSSWVRDYAMFMSLKEHFSHKPLWLWPDRDIVRRDETKMKYYAEALKDNIEFFIFVQYLFFKQWRQMKEYANSQGIQIIGDIPIYPSANSSDVWSNPNMFKLDKDLILTSVAGVPPDLYSETGQLWGNPIYDWDKHKEQGYRWWIDRIKNCLKMADVIRIDHFRGFCDYWEIAAGETTAINGKWMPGPKMELFDAIKKELGDVPFIAEDLGIITDEVREFLNQTGYPGMKVMIFGFSANEDNIYQAHNWPKNCIAYTSTHDSETFRQKVEESTKEDRKFILDYIRADHKENFSMDAICTAFASAASIVMIPMQDLLFLGKEGRINIPSTVGGNNWRWRMKKSGESIVLAIKLKHITKIYRR